MSTRALDQFNDWLVQQATKNVKVKLDAPQVSEDLVNHPAVNAALQSPSTKPWAHGRTCKATDTRCQFCADCPYYCDCLNCPACYICDKAS